MTSGGVERAAPLDGVRVVAIEQYGAGPFGSMFLADMGAEIVKIEDPTVGGDVSRYIPPGQESTNSLFFESFNRGKKSIALDLKSVAGREVFDRLVASADAVYSNLRGDQPARLRITYEHLAPINPRIVCVALTGYGRSGEAATLPGYDALIQAEAGWAAMTGEPDGPPTKSGLSLADYITGLVSVVGLLVALYETHRTGLGRDVDTSLYDSALSMLSYPAVWYLSRGIRSQRHPLSAHPSVVPFQFFETADGHIAIACPKEKFFRALISRMELPDIAADARFENFTTRSRHRAELVEILNRRFKEATTQQWLERLRGVVPVAPVRSMEEALDADELAARQMLASYEHPVLGVVRSVASPLRMSGYEPRYTPGPAFDGDRAELLTELGYSAADLERLGQAGAFGRAAPASTRKEKSVHAG
ncbi:MAG: CoA transferase [Gemmatimonadaceae bacterium]|nr:CoA transferase [Gemmatimonadaceae bacterium]